MKPADTPGDGSSVHFPGLNSLRFFAAATVWVTHSMAILEGAGFPPVLPLEALHPDTGKLGVIFFFVLSGFLITYLLQTEKGRTGTVRVGRFYVRRALRIWPIYYLMVVGGFFLLPWLQSEVVRQYVASRVSQDLPLFLFFVPNFAAYIPLIAHLWSIGAEEQFYLAWPWFHRLFRNMYVVCAAVILAQLGALLVLQGSEPGSGFAYRLFLALLVSRFDCMAIGGIVATLLFDDVKPVLRILMWKGTSLIALALLVLLYVQGFRHTTLGFSVFGVLFGVLILNIAANPESPIKLEWRWTDYLGRISYGLYVYHPLAIFLVSLGATSLVSPADGSRVATGGLILLSGLFTAALSAVSYHYYESAFLRLKKRFSSVVSSDLARVEASEAAAS